MQAISTPPNTLTTLPFERWDNEICNRFCAMQIEPSAAIKTFSGSLASRNLERTSVSVVSSTALLVNRYRKHIAAAEQPYYLLKIQLQGTSVIRQYGNEACLQPGDFTLCSSTEPYQLFFPDTYSQAVFSVPQPLLQELIHSPERFLGRRQPGKIAANNVFVQFATSIFTQADQMSPELVSRLEANVLDVLVTALEAGQHGGAGAGVKTEYLYRIKQFIHAHLQDPELGPDKISAALGVSKRYLHMVFEGQGITLARYILYRRLESCRACLGKPEFAHLSVSEIAFKHGFNDAAHFSRSFKQLFGKTPSQLRLTG